MLKVEPGGGRSWNKCSGGRWFSGGIFVLSKGDMPAFLNAEIRFSAVKPLLYVLLLTAATLYLH